MCLFYFKYLKYVFLIILAYFYLCKIFNAGFLLVTKYFYSVLFVLLLKLRIWALPPPPPPPPPLHTDNKMLLAVASCKILKFVCLWGLHCSVCVTALTMCLLFPSSVHPSVRLSVRLWVWLPSWAPSWLRLIRLTCPSAFHQLIDSAGQCSGSLSSVLQIVCSASVSCL